MIIKVIVVVFVLCLLGGCGGGGISDYGLSILNRYEPITYSGYMSGGHVTSGCSNGARY